MKELNGFDFQQISVSEVKKILKEKHVKTVVNVGTISPIID